MNSQSVMKLVVAATMISTVSLLVACGKKSKDPASGATAAAETSTSLRPQDAARLFNRALSSYTGNGVPLDRTNAFALFTQAARMGHKEAQARLGWMYLQGDAVAKDEHKAAELLRQSADQGFAKAQNDYGVLSQRGIGMTNNFFDAVHWYDLAARAELPVAQNNLSLMYLSGVGVDRDNDKAVEWMRKASEHGYRRAQCALGNMAVEGCGMKPDYTEAFKAFLKAAEQVDPAAQGTVGTMYHVGIGTNTNFAEAAKWLRLAADQGNPAAEEELSAMYLAGEGIDMDLGAIVELLKQSAEHNFTPAQFELGLLYSQGLGLAKDPTEAIHWFRLAATQGHDLARLYVTVYERDRLQHSLNMDSVVLNSGETISGRLVSEAESNVEIEVANASRTIYTAQTIAKADIKSLQRESPEHREQRPQCEELLKYKLNPDQEYPAKVSVEAIAKLSAFLKHYPQSEFAPGLQSILDAWQYEAAQQAKGLVKFAGIWMTPDEKKPLLAARDKLVEAQRQASPQHRARKPAELHELLQAAQRRWIDTCTRLGRLSAGGSQPADAAKWQQDLIDLRTNIANYQRELGFSTGDESIGGRKSRTIGYGNVDAMTEAVLAGDSGEGTWVGTNPSPIAATIRAMPIQVRNIGPFGPLINPVLGN